MARLIEVVAADLAAVRRLRVDLSKELEALTVQREHAESLRAMANAREHALISELFVLVDGMEA